MHRVSETIGGLWALLMLGVQTRFRVRGAYWRWRYETAFGSKPNQHTSRWGRIKAMIEYGRWVHRMKRSM